MQSQRLAVTLRVLISSFLLLMMAVPAFAIDNAPPVKESGSWMGGIASIVLVLGVAVVSFIAPKRTNKD